ncbi:MAG TPA: RDD family protein [Chryseosolibacter sp.]
MKNIEIITTQNVVLQYELAPLKDRIMAFVLDMVCLVFGLSILSTFFAAIFNFSETAQGFSIIILTCIACLYSLGFEFFNNGRSIGKMAMKIQVIKLAGGRATFSDYAARWVFRLIDIWFSFGGIASILVMSSAKAQRIGDIIANTAVVKTAPKLNVNLQDILAIHKANKYTPKYLQAKKLQEQDALLIKSALERYRRFYNESHEEALELLTARVKEMLGIDYITEERSVFLQTVLQDYVVLSR